MKPAGKFAILLLVIGFAYGALRWYQQTTGKSVVSLPGRSGAAGSGSDPSNGGGSGGEPANVRGGELELITSATKKGWLEKQAELFSARSGGKTTIRIRYIETRAAMQAILTGREKPVLWSPSSPIWAKRLAQVWTDPKFHPGEPPVIDTQDNRRFRSYLRTPIVFLTTKERARYLRPLLSGPDPWGAIRDLSLGKRSVPGMGGKFRFAHADPLNANSGFLTIGMILDSYSRKSGGGDDLVRIASSAGFVQYLTELERGLVYDEPVRGGSSALVKAFLDNPSRYGVITSYESSALDAARSYPDIAVIYPNPTVVSEQTVVVLSGKWVSPEQQDAAQAFLEFLRQPDSLSEGVKGNFRAADETGPALTDTLRRNREQGFQQNYSAIDLPPYDALNAAAFQWRVHVARLSATAARR
ncbi:MAG: substrate-binding domain-containing protein [Cytophagales bacterium]|nr:substrate-binding domain-containing protein [Armatimonadota bacterium]